MIDENKTGIAMLDELIDLLDLEINASNLIKEYKINFSYKEIRYNILFQYNDENSLKVFKFHKIYLTIDYKIDVKMINEIKAEKEIEKEQQFMMIEIHPNNKNKKVNKI